MPDVRYVGKDGEHYHGIPAADMTEEEFDSLTDEQKATVAGSPLYKLSGAVEKDAESASRRVAREMRAENPTIETGKAS